MDVIADVINRQYVEHKAWFQCAARTRVDAGVRSAVAGPTEAAVLQYKGFRYHGQASPPEDFLGLVVLNGHGSFTRARERVHFTRGDAILLPSDQRFDADMDDCVFALVRIPERFVDLLAEEHAGLPATGLRIESIAPVSVSARALWSRTAMFICRQLLGSSEAGISPIVVQEMTRLAAATILESFPNTTMTTDYVPDPGRVPSATVRRAAGFIVAHAGQPVTIAEIAGRAGVTPRALQYALRHDHHRLSAPDPAGARAPGSEGRRPHHRRDRREHRSPLGLGQPGRLRLRLPQAVRGAAQQHAAYLRPPACI
jgi:hypothetical protein